MDKMRQYIALQHKNYVTASLKMLTYIMSHGWCRKMDLKITREQAPRFSPPKITLRYPKSRFNSTVSPSNEKTSNNVQKSERENSIEKGFRCLVHTVQNNFSNTQTPRKSSHILIFASVRASPWFRAQWPKLIQTNPLVMLSTSVFALEMACIMVTRHGW